MQVTGITTGICFWWWKMFHFDSRDCISDENWRCDYCTPGSVTKWSILNLLSHKVGILPGFSRITIFGCYPGEKTRLDFSTMPLSLEITQEVIVHKNLHDHQTAKSLADLKAS